MEPSHPAFSQFGNHTIPSQFGKCAIILPKHVYPVGPDSQRRQNVLGLHIFRNLAEKKINMAAMNMEKFKWTYNLSK